MVHTHTHTHTQCQIFHFKLFLVGFSKTYQTHPILLNSWNVRAKLLQSCPTLCDPMNCKPAGSSVHGVLQARILELVTMPSSRGSSLPKDQTHVSNVSCTGKQTGPLSPASPGNPNSWNSLWLLICLIDYLRSIITISYFFSKCKTCNFPF